MTQTMAQMKGDAYVAAWAGNIARSLGERESHVLWVTERLHGHTRIGDLTPEQAQAVVAEARFWSSRARQAYDDAERAAAAYERQMDEEI